MAGSDGALSQREITALLTGQMDIDPDNTEVLSQEEIEQLLDAINAGTVNTKVDKSTDTVKIKIFDFKRPDRFTRAHIAALNIIHDELCTELTNFLSGYLKGNVLVKVASIDQLTYDEFIRCIPQSTFLSVINLHPLQGSALVEIDPSSYKPMLDMLFGGYGDGTRYKAELTNLENFVLEKLIVRSFDGIRDSWKSIIEFTPELAATENSPQNVKITPPGEMVILVTCECKVNDVEGMINICYPYPVIAPIRSKIKSTYYNLGVQAMNKPAKPEAPQTVMDQATIPVSVMLGETSLTLEDIKRMGEGSILELDKTVDQLMDIYAGGVIIARGEVVTIDDNFGIRITEVGEKNGNAESK